MITDSILLRFVLVFTVALSGTGGVVAQDFEGAEALLKWLAEQAKVKPAADNAPDPVRELGRKLEAFRKDAGSLPPAEAAERWLLLFDTYAALPHEALQGTRYTRERLSIEMFMQSLPPVAAWPALERALNSRSAGTDALRDGGLRVLLAVLRSDPGARGQSIAALRETVKKEATLESYERQGLEDRIGQIERLLAQATGTGDERAAEFARELDAWESEDSAKREEFDDSSVAIPDLVRLVGKDRAAPLILRALRLDADLEVDGQATPRLAAELALQHIGELKRPVWQLVETSAELALYEALAAKFPEAEPSYEKSEADSVYLLLLIGADRTQEAAAFARKVATPTAGGTFRLSATDIDALQQQGLGRQVRAFLREILAQEPTLPFWETFISLSAKENKAPDALAVLEQVIAQPGIDDHARTEVRRHLSAALLAADRTEDGLRLLRELVQAGPRAGAADAQKLADESRRRWQQLGVDVTPAQLASFAQTAHGLTDSGAADHVELALRLARLGQLLGMPEIMEEGLAAAKASCLNPAAADYRLQRSVEQLVTVLLDLGRGPEAERLVAAVLAAGLAATDRDASNRGSDNPAHLMAALAVVYDRNDRPADVLQLLDESTYWGALDLAGLTTTTFGSTPLTLVAARSLARLGRTDEARRVVLRTLQDYPNKDAAYELLLSLGGDAIEADLDRLYQADRFEERPLIWKAQHQLATGDVAGAEKSIRAAIAIDPSDGEQGKGDRMRAYAVLAEVLQKSGDADQAKIMHGAVAAIRLSENADDWWDAGLLSRAVGIYERALGLFADAYCIQSRLALRYSELGDMAKAEMHYRRAFELMPESFGRIESHCFGCEGSFAGPRAQTIAEQVFTQLAEKMPDRPQVFYLLGYLREQQQRVAEAAGYFRKAIELDPDYLNAWKNLGDIADEAGLDPAERDRISFALFRLDPRGRHVSHDLDPITDLQRLWEAILAAESALPPRAEGPIYVLAAVRADAGRRQPGIDWESVDQPSFFDRRNNPREHFSRHPAIGATAALLDAVSRRE